MIAAVSLRSIRGPRLAFVAWCFCVCCNSLSLKPPSGPIRSVMVDWGGDRELRLFPACGSRVMSVVVGA